jgi:hypothetical protein
MFRPYLRVNIIAETDFLHSPEISDFGVSQQVVLVLISCSSVRCVAVSAVTGGPPPFPVEGPIRRGIAIAAS